jgi:hypothetical protein
LQKISYRPRYEGPFAGPDPRDVVKIALSMESIKILVVDNMQFGKEELDRFRCHALESTFNNRYK